MRRGSAGLVWGAVGLVLAAAPIAAAWLPLVTEVTVSAGPHVATGPAASAVVTTSRQRALVESEGVAVLVPMAVPMCVAAVPLLFRRSPRAGALRVAAAVMLGFGCLAALASVGLFYLPALAALVAAAISGRSTRARTAAPPGTADSPRPASGGSSLQG
jgi:hypothetical protein